MGGTIAANLSGPRRAAYGSIRDLVIGVRAGLITGEHIKAGGKVVKNVAGYDLCKLFVGSLGTLGIITEATLRTVPIPETSGTVTASGGFTKVRRAAEAVLDSQLTPTAVFLRQRNGTQTDETNIEWELAVACEGFDVTVQRHLDDAQRFAESEDLAILKLADPDHELYWDGVRDFPLTDGGAIYRIVVPRAAIATILERFPVPRADFAADLLSGVIWTRTAETWIPEQFRKLAELARDHHGHATLVAAPPQAKKGLDVWGPAPESLSIMREVKRQFDPHGLLNRGRFLAGL